MEWRELLDEFAARLGRTEAGFVVADVGHRPADLLTLGGGRVDDAAVVRARQMAARVEGGEPLQHVLGTWGFRSLELVVDGRALVPRPETEVVVGHALAVLDGARPPGSPSLAVDLGTGSGAIACALVAERPGVEVVAIDRSLDALALASVNRARLGSESRRIHLVATSWGDAIGGGLCGAADLVVANPPYLSEAEWRAAPAVVRDFDPRDSLVGGLVGTEAIAQVVGAARRLVAPRGALVVEIGAGQAEAVARIASACGAVAEVAPDLTGRDRVATVRW